MKKPPQSVTMLDQTLALLYAWRDASQAVALHIFGCMQCEEADLPRRDKTLPRLYCLTGEALWAEAMRLEAQVIAILPNLPAEITNEIPANFKFMTGHE